MDTKVPKNLDVITDLSALEELEAQLLDEFNTKSEDADVPNAELLKIAETVKEVQARMAEVEADNKATQAERDEIAKSITPYAEQEHDDDDDDDDGDDGTDAVDETDDEDETEAVDETDEVEQVDDETETETETVDEPEPVLAASRPSARKVSRKASKPKPPDVGRPPLNITASADLGDFTLGQSMTPADIAAAMHAKAKNLPDLPEMGSKTSICKIEVPIPDENIVQNTSLEEAERAIAAATTVPQRSGMNAAESLVASGGWCAPSEIMYELFAIESREAIFDLPSVGVRRGGMQVPSYIGIGAEQGALWSWTETDDQGTAPKTVTNRAITSEVATLTVTAHGWAVGQHVRVTGVGADYDGMRQITTVPTADTFTYAVPGAGDDTSGAAPAGSQARLVKGYQVVPCPTHTDYRLKLEGYTVQNGNLQEAAYPEATTRYVNLVVTMHLHRVGLDKLNKLIAFAGANEQVTYTRASDATGDILFAIGHSVETFRSKHLYTRNTPVESAFPVWVHEACRASLAMRQGVESYNISDAEIAGWFATRNIRPQFVYAYQPLYTGPGLPTTYPATVDFPIWVSGGIFGGTGPSIELGVVRDSTLNETNDHTVAWSEQSYSVMNRGPAPHVVTAPVNVDGKTGGVAP